MKLNINERTVFVQSADLSANGFINLCIDFIDKIENKRVLEMAKSALPKGTKPTYTFFVKVKFSNSEYTLDYDSRQFKMNNIDTSIIDSFIKENIADIRNSVEEYRKRSLLSVFKETEHLLATKANRDRLRESINQIDDNELIEYNLD